jgi:hypothetical protein
MKKWLRHIEYLSDTEEEMVYIYEPKIGRHLSNEEEVRIEEDPINYQEGRSELSNCQVGNGRISVDDLIDF